MPDPYEQATRDADADTFRRHFMARLDLAQMSGEKLVQEYRQRMAELFSAAGLTLIPSDHLRDHEFVVSRGVYESAKRMMK